MSKPRVSVIEVTFEDGSADSIQFFPAGNGNGIRLCDWTRKRKGRNRKTGAYTKTAIAAYLYELSCRGECFDYNRFDLLALALQKTYDSYRV
jgi:hypothetical protein